MRKVASIALGKTVNALSQLAGHGGGNLPGKVARKIDRRVLAKLAKNVDHIILVTGTNGKTTASGILAKILHEDGKELIHNHEGNNLITGITSLFVANAKNGKIKEKYAVLEVDELSMIPVLKEVSPTHIIITNFFRDQLHRIGEIDTLVKRIMEAITPHNTTLILNADDPIVTRFASLGKRTLYYGLHEKSITFPKQETSESKYCPTCGKHLVYDHVHYSQLGYYWCECGFRRPTPNVEVTKIEHQTFTTNHGQYTLPLEGTYNVYNALAAITVGNDLGISVPMMIRSVGKLKASNGRMEKVVINNHEHVINLIKNPAGFNSTLSTILQDKEAKRVGFVLNDLAADSEDISWIWDCDIETMVKERPDLTYVVSGTRLYDFLLRLKYGGVKKENIIIGDKMIDFINETANQSERSYLLPTYTALSAVKKVLGELPKGGN